MNAPATPEELAEAVRAMPRVLAIGAGTKPRLSMVDVPKLSTIRLSGIVEYEPDEFTFTALAGTPVREIAAALAERGQYLPFDPMLCEAGATLGGTVAAGLSGPGRFRFGGLRDFIIGVRFVDGMGRLLHMGGKVVKNAAGFDLPKFFVGSLGRFGVLAEMTFKVFPLPPSARTLRLASGTLDAAVRVLIDAANSRYEFEALDIPPTEMGVLARIAGPAPALDAMEAEILSRWPGAALSKDDAEAAWTCLNEFQWVGADASLVKVALPPDAVVPLGTALQRMDAARMHVSAGGNVAYVSLGGAAPSEAFEACLQGLKLSGLTLRGAAPLRQGVRERPAIIPDVKHALDPANRFPALDE
jgi:glycolate oxidase FAD binding subunit